MVPLQLTPAASVSGALGGVFSQSTVSFSLSATGTPKLRGYTLRLTVSNPTGGPLSGGSADDSELSVLHDGTDLADLLGTRRAFFVRLDVPGIDALMARSGVPATSSLRAALEQELSLHPRWTYLRSLLDGSWVGVRAASVERYLRTATRRLGGPGKVRVQARAVRAAAVSSFADAWDLWASIRQKSSSHGVTEYSMSLPVRRFVASFLQGIERRLRKTVPQVAHLAPLARHGLLRIPASLSLPVDLYVANGSLVKVAVSYHGRGVVVLIGHPSPLVAPGDATYASLPELEQLFFSASSSSASSSLPIVSTPPAASASPLSDPALQLSLVITEQADVRTRSFSRIESPAWRQKVLHSAGLRLALGAPVASPRAVSAVVGASGRFLVLVTPDPATGRCMGTLEVDASARALGATRRPGVYFFETSERGGSCDAAGLGTVAVTRSTAMGSAWTGYAPLGGGPPAAGVPGNSSTASGAGA